MKEDWYQQGTHIDVKDMKRELFRMSPCWPYSYSRLQLFLPSDKMQFSVCSMKLCTHVGRKFIPLHEIICQLIDISINLSPSFLRVRMYVCMYVWFDFVLWHIKHYRVFNSKSFLYKHIRYMISDEILLLTFLNEPEFIFCCTQLNGFTPFYVIWIILSTMIHFFAHSLMFSISNMYHYQFI